MTDKSYLEHMIAWCKRLERDANAEPLDRQIFHDTAELMIAIHKVHMRLRRRRLWFAGILIFVLWVLLGLLVVDILF